MAIPGDIASVANVSNGGIRPERNRSDSGSELGFGDSSLGGGRLSETRVTLLSNDDQLPMGTSSKNPLTWVQVIVSEELCGVGCDELVEKQPLASVFHS